MLDTLNRISLGFPQEDNYPLFSTIHASIKKPIALVKISIDGLKIEGIEIATSGSFRTLEIGEKVRGPHCKLDNIEKQAVKINLLINGSKRFKAIPELKSGLMGSFFNAVAVFCNLENAKEIILSELAERAMSATDAKEVVVLFTTEGLDIRSESYLTNLHKAVDSAKINGNTSKNIQDFTGDIGPPSVSLVKKVNFKVIGLITPYARNKESKSDYIYGKSEADPCPMTEATSERISMAFSALANPELLYGKIAQSMSFEGEGKLLSITCPFDQYGNLIKSIDKNISNLLNGGESEINEGKTYTEKYEDDGDEEDNIIEENNVNNNVNQIGKEEKLRTITEMFKKSMDAISKTSSDYPKASVRIELYSVKEKGGTLYPLIKKSVGLSEMSEILKIWYSITGDGPKELSGINITNKYIDTYCVPIGFKKVWRILNARWTKSAGVLSGKIDNDYLKAIRGIKKSDNDRWMPVIKYSEMLNFGLTLDPVIADKIISIIAQYHFWMMIDIAHRRHHKRFDSKVNLMISGCRRDFYRMPSVIAIALHAKGITMSQVSESPAYLFGVACSIANEMQAAYHDYQEQNIPTSLVGYKTMSLIPTGRTWIQLIDQLSSSVEAYQSKELSLNQRLENATESKRDKAQNLVIKCRIFKKVMDAIEVNIIPLDQRMTDTEKGIAALGFQQGYRKRESVQESITTA